MCKNIIEENILPVIWIFESRIDKISNNHIYIFVKIWIGKKLV